jgi:hypothetical protein
MDIKQKYREETNLEPYFDLVDNYVSYTKQYVKWLEEQLRLHLVSNWVAVEEALPLVTGFYTVAKPTKPYVLGLYFDSDKNFRYDKQVHKNITHWQKLPKPPCL